MGKYFTRPLFRLFHRKHDERSRQQSNPPVPTKPSLTLPPEMLDEILDHIPMNREGVRTLLACALVATSWAGPSQRRLFSSVDVRRGNYKWWMDGVVYSGSKDHLLKYVRSLQYSRGLDFRMRDLPWDSGEYLSALHNIHSLKFCDTRIERLDEEGFRICFSAFRETLTCLSLETFATSFNAFVTLVDYFPNLTTLRLRPFVLEPDEGPVPSLSRPLRGKLRVRDGHGDCLKFFNRFAKLDLEFEELVISSGSSMFVEMAFLNSALKLSANTIKFLRVTTEPEGEQPLPALPIKTTHLPNPLTFKSRVHFRSRTSDNSKSWNWWWLGENPFVKSSSLQSVPQK